MFVYLSIHLSCLYVFLSFYKYPYIYPSIYLSINPSVHLSIHLSIYLLMYLSIHLSLFKSIHPFIHISIFYYIIDNINTCPKCLSDASFILRILQFPIKSELVVIGRMRIASV